MRFYPLLFLFFSGFISAQTYKISGTVVDEKANPLPYSTVALLSPADSTLLFYSVTGAFGNYELKNIPVGNYILQAAFLGYKTYQRIYTVPNEKINESLVILLLPTSINLPAAEITEERIPLLFHGDTIEYNASSYKTQPDAVVEDLLKKLPGIEVDRDGNIKAQGEDVKKITVDGKEFFGNDPKIATKNLPADAVKKVDVFDTKSDEAQLTGIDDGKRDKTIDLKLKDDKKKSWFGDVQAGGGTENHFQSSAKIYRFMPDKQFAALGMANNINRFGFSFSDYMNFSGGPGSLGESFTNAHDENSFPIDFGQTENGLITSGAAGLNFSQEKIKDKRFHVSYLANGINKKLRSNNALTNFTGLSQVNSFEDKYSKTLNRAHRFELGWKNKSDTIHVFGIDVDGSINSSDENSQASLRNFSVDQLLNNTQTNNSSEGRSFVTNLHSGLLNKLKSNWKYFNVEVNGTWKHGLSSNELSSFSNHAINPSLYSGQYRENNNDLIRYSASGSITRKIGALIYLESKISGGREYESFKKATNYSLADPEEVDSLSADLQKTSEWIEPRIKFKLITKKTRVSLSAGYFINSFSNEINNGKLISNNYNYFLPAFSWEKEYKSAHRLRFIYESEVNTPKANQLFPKAEYINSITSISGNQSLKPEVQHNVSFNWSLFDQFSFTSVFAGLRVTYIKDKISWSKTIDSNFVQRTELINVKDYYQCGGSIEYSAPVRKAGININLSYDEKLERSLTLINYLENQNTVVSHQPALSVDNRKKTRWDITAGVKLNFVSATYTLPSVPNQTYRRLDLFSDINFNPSTSWHFSVKADISNYKGASFNSDLSVPLLQAEVSYSLLKNKRGVFILDAFDILNRNTGIERISENNYVSEIHSDIIGRYVMLSFRYRLSKFNSDNKVDVKIN